MGRVRVRSESVPLTLLLTDLDPGIRCKVLHDTAERVYHLPAPPTV